MEKQRFGRILLLIIIVLLLIWGGTRLYVRFAANSGGVVSQAKGGEAAPANQAAAALPLPPLPKSPAVMTEAEKSAAINQAAADAQEAATAAGQSAETVKQAGAAMRKAADAAFHRPADIIAP